MVEKSGGKKEAMVHSILPRLHIWIEKKKLMSNDLIWWFHRRSGIAMFPPTSSKWLHDHFCVRWDEGSGVDSHQPAQKHNLPESLSLAMREKHKSKRAKVESEQRAWGEQQHRKPRWEHSQDQASLWFSVLPLPDLTAKARHPPSKPTHVSRTYTATFPFCEEVCFLSPAL